MNVNWHAIVKFAADNKVVLGLLATAGISTMPQPGAKVSWLTLYTWIYDWAHQFPNIKRPSSDAPKPNP